MRSLTKVAALCATVLAACGGGGIGGADPSGGGGGGSWHRTTVGDSFAVLDVSYDLVGEGCVTLDVSDAGTYAA